MNKKEEYNLEEQCRLYACQMGCVLVKLANNGYTGIPDDLFINHDGTKIYLIEFKKNRSQKLRHEQNTWFARYPKLCIRIDNIDDLIKLCDDVR